MLLNRSVIPCLIVILLTALQAFGLTKVADVSQGQLTRIEYAQFGDPAFPSSDPEFQSPLAEGTFDFFVHNPDPEFQGTAFLNVFVDLDPPWSTEPQGIEWIVKNVPYLVPDCITAPVHSVWIDPHEFDRPSTGPTDFPTPKEIIPGLPYTTFACLSAEELDGPPIETEILSLDLSHLPAGLSFWGLMDGPLLPSVGETYDAFGQQESAPAIPTTEEAKTEGTTSSSIKDRVTMPDIAQKPMECGPTSAANSIRWLAETNGFNDKLPKKNDDLIKELMKAMTGSDERPFGGLSGNQLHDGKKKYAEEKGLPITVKGGMSDPNANGAKAFDFIKKEIDDGEDVELLIGWPNGKFSHWVTVVGYKVNKKRLFLTVNDPDDGKTGSVTWELDRKGNFIKPKGKMLWAVSESPIEEPTTTPPPSTTPPDTGGPGGTGGF